MFRRCWCGVRSLAELDVDAHVTQTLDGLFDAKFWGIVFEGIEASQADGSGD